MPSNTFTTVTHDVEHLLKYSETTYRDTGENQIKNESNLFNHLYLKHAYDSILELSRNHDLCKCVSPSHSVGALIINVHRIEIVLFI